MTNPQLMIRAKARDGRVAEFERFYDEVHIPEVLATYPEVLSAVRYRLTPTLSHQVERTHDSLAVYEVAGDVAELWARISAGRSMTVSDAFDYTSIEVSFAGPAGPAVPNTLP